MREVLAPPRAPSVGDSDSDSFMSGTESSYASEADESELEDDYVGKPKRESAYVVVVLEYG